MSWLEEENCLQGPSEWCFNCIQTAWGFLPEAFWSSVDNTVCKSEAVSVLSFVLMQIPEQDSKREQQLSHLIPWVELLFAPALGEDACCRLRLPLSSLLVKDQFVDVCLWKASWASWKQKMLLLVQSLFCPFWADILSTQTCESAISSLPAVVLCFTTFFFFPLHFMEQVISLFFTETFLEFFCAAVGVKCYMGGRSQITPPFHDSQLLLLSQCRYKWRVTPVWKRTKGSFVISGEKGNCRLRKKKWLLPSHHWLSIFLIIWDCFLFSISFSPAWIYPFFLL